VIIKGGAAGNVRWWQNHLQREDTNDRAEIKEISGLLATDLLTALREMQAIAGQSRSGGNFMYQANLNPEAHEHLTEAQWQEAIDTLENYLGLAGHQRVVVEHEKEQRTHRHVVWNRVDVHTLRVTDIGGNYYTHERVARTLELKFGLDRTASLHGERHPEGRPERRPELWEKRAAERTGIDPKLIKSELSGLWRACDNGRAFAAGLAERGYILAQGTRRDFCIVDHAGVVHSLARRIDGAKAKDVRERLDHLDPEMLPTVEEARAQQREKHPTPEAARQAWEGRYRMAPGGPAPDYINTPHRPDPGREAKPNSAPRADRTARSAGRSEFEAGPLPDDIAAARLAAAAQESGARPKPAPGSARNEPRGAQREAFDAKVQDAWRRSRDAEVDRVTAREKPSVAKAGLRVANAATGSVGLLSGFVESLLVGGGRSEPADGTDRIREQRRAQAALERMAESMARGEDLRAADVAALTATHLSNIKTRGDDYLRNLLERMERERQNEHGRDRERERDR
jgi:hypothetical protein